MTTFVTQNFTFPDPASHSYNDSVIRRIDFEFSMNDTVGGGDAGMWAILFDRGKHTFSSNVTLINVYQLY